MAQNKVRTDIAVFKQSDKEKIPYWPLIEKMCSNRKEKLKINFIPDEDFSTNKTLMLRGTRAITKDGIEFYVIGENTL